MQLGRKDLHVELVYRLGDPGWLVEDHDSAAGGKLAERHGQGLSPRPHQEIALRFVAQKQSVHRGDVDIDTSTFIPQTVQELRRRLGALRTSKGARRQCVVREVEALQVHVEDGVTCSGSRSRQKRRGVVGLFVPQITNREEEVHSIRRSP